MHEPFVGKIIDRYEIISLIGRGGMADVYQAHQIGMNREVAVKVLSPSLNRSGDFVERFKREISLVTRLEHAHIVPVYETGLTGEGTAYLAMRYIKGGTLSERIARQKALPLEDINRILQQIAGALDYAHNHGVTHRDIKPSNVLLDEQGDAYLADFGLATLDDVQEQQNLTRTGILVGTPNYIAPEQAMESRSSPRSDLYSLGVVLYEMLTGHPPFSGDTLFAIMQAHVDTPPPPPRQIMPALPPAVDDVLARALAKNPDLRYPNALALARDFAIATQGGYITPPPVPTGAMPTLDPRGLFRRASSTATLATTQPHANLRGRYFTVGLVTVLLMLVGVVILPNILQSVTTPPTPTPLSLIDRPASGVVADVALTLAEIERAQQVSTGSFIGLIACTLETEFHAGLIAAMRVRATDLGFTVQVQNAETDSFKQTTLIQQYIAQGAKAIVMCVLDEKLLEASILTANQAGIPVVINGDMAYGPLSTTFTLTSATMGHEVGTYAARYINDTMGGTATIIILDYPDLQNIVLRADSMEQAVTHDAPGVKVVGRYLGGLADNGEKSVAQALQEHPEINVILSINDAGALGAVKALRAAGKKPDEVSIFSVDAESAARQLIANGEYFRASLATDADALGSLMVNAAVKTLGGGIVPRQVLLTGTMITRESLQNLQTTPTAQP